MRRRVSLATALVVGAALAIPATSGAQTAAQDSAVGSGAASSFPQFDFSATSDPLSGSPSGSASFNVFGAFQFQGTVSCLGVSGNRAVIGVDIDQQTGGFNFEGFFLTVVDGGPAGSGLDTFDAVPTSFSGPNIVPTDCSQPPPPFSSSQVTSGDIVVRDAPPFPTSKEQCKNGGWRDFGVFKNQGDCVSFVATGGKNPPGGP